MRALARRLQVCGGGTSKVLTRIGSTTSAGAFGRHRLFDGSLRLLLIVADKSIQGTVDLNERDALQ